MVQSTHAQEPPSGTSSPGLITAPLLPPPMLGGIAPPIPPSVAMPPVPGLPPNMGALQPPMSFPPMLPPFSMPPPGFPGFKPVSVSNIIRLNSTTEAAYNNVQDTKNFILHYTWSSLWSILLILLNHKKRNENIFCSNVLEFFDHTSVADVLLQCYFLFQKIWLLINCIGYIAAIKVFLTIIWIVYSKIIVTRIMVIVRYLIWCVGCFQWLAVISLL